MAAPRGNQFWKARSKHGRDKIFADPEVLRAACYEYFEWVEKNPLREEKVFSAAEGLRRTYVKKMRAMTLGGLCLFLGIDRKTLDLYREREDFIPILREAEEIIYAQKFAGAAADMLNASIIARDLGLRDKQDVEHSGSVERRIDLSDLSTKERAALREILAMKNTNDGLGRGKK